MTPLLAKDIAQAFMEVEKLAAAGTKNFNPHVEIGKRLAAAIEKYVKAADVVVDTDTPNIQILAGQTTPLGSTITNGMPAVGSTKGKGMGKII